MLRNANLTDDTMNAVLFLLIATNNSKERYHSAQLTVIEDEAEALSQLLAEKGISDNPHHTALKNKIIDVLKKKQDQRTCNTPMFTLDDASQYFSQVYSTRPKVDRISESRVKSYFWERETSPLTVDGQI